MKLSRKLLLALAVLVVLVVVAAGVAMNSSFQTWLVRRNLPVTPGTEITVDRVAAGLAEARVSGLRVKQSGSTVFTNLTLKYSAMSLIGGGAVVIESVSIEEAVIDLRTAGSTTASPGDTGPATTPSAPTAGEPGTASAPRAPAVVSEPGFQGILSDLALPMDVRVDKVAGKGRVLLDAGRIVRWDFSGTGPAAGREARLDWTAQYEDPGISRSLTGAEARGSVVVAIGSRLDVMRLALDAGVTASGAAIPLDRLQIAGQAARAGAGRDESYAFSIGLERDGALERIAMIESRFDAAKREFEGTWDIKAGTSQLAGWLDRLGLPEISATGKGRLAYVLGEDRGTLAGDIDAELSKLETISPALRSPGSMRVAVAIESSIQDRVLRVGKFDVHAGASGQRMFRVEALQPVSIDIDSGRLSFANAAAGVALLAIDGLPLAWAQPWLGPLQVNSGNLSGVLLVEGEPEGRRARLRSQTPITLRDVSLRNAGSLVASGAGLTTGVQVDLSDERVALALEDLRFDLNPEERITGLVRLDLSTRDAVRNGGFFIQLSGRVDELIRSRLLVPTGPLNVTTVVEGRLEGDVLRVARASASVGLDGREGRLLAVTTSGPVSIPISGDLLPHDGAGVLLELGDPIPLAWLRSHMPNLALAGNVTGGAFVVAVKGPRDYSVTTRTPLTLTGVGAAQPDGTEIASDLGISAVLNAVRSGDSVNYTLSRLEVRGGTSPMLTLVSAGVVDIEGSRYSTQSKGTIEADLAVLSQQPLLAATLPLSRGTLNVGFELDRGTGTSAKINLAARNLVGRQGNVPLGNLDTAAEVTMSDTGAGTLRVPLVLTVGGRRSDVTVSGAFEKASPGYSFNGRITGDQLIVNDLTPLGALVPSSPGPSAAATVRNTRDSVPFWNGFQGRVEADFRRLQLATGALVENFKSAVAGSENRMAVEVLTGTFARSPFRFAGTVTFNGALARPYSATGDLAITGLDVGEVLRAANPNDRPSLETLLTMSARVAGTGATMQGLAAGLTGQFEATGSAGRLRALGRRGQAAGAVSTIFGIIGAIQGSDTSLAISQLAAEMNEMPFERIAIKAERTSDLGVRLSSLELVSPTLKVNGSGRIDHREGGTLAQDPMTLELRLAAKDHMALLFGNVGALGTTPDSGGYYPVTRAVSLTGSASRPDAGQFWAWLAQIAAGRLLER